MNTNHTDSVEAIIQEWRDKFTYQREPGNVELAHVLVNDDGYVEPYSGGDTNEVHQHEKWLRDKLTTLQATHSQQVEEAVSHMAWCPQCGDALEQQGTRNDYSCFGCGDIHYKLTPNHQD